MRALVCHEYGTPDVLRIEERPAPALPPGHVRIATRLAGISFAVVLGIAGRHQNRPGLPYVPAAAGERVAALVRGGGYAAQVVAPANTVWKIPEGVDDAQALVMAGTQAGLFLSLDWLARLQPDETLLVHGAGGGSGLGAVILGRAMGARVVATASTPAKRS